MAVIRSDADGRERLFAFCGQLLPSALQSICRPVSRRRTWPQPRS